MKNILFYFPYAITTITFILLLNIESYSQYIVDFEGVGETKTSYTQGEVTLSGLTWDFNQALIGTSANDWKNGARSARLRGHNNSCIVMVNNKLNGIGTISFAYRKYGNDLQKEWKVEYSTDEGLNWLQLGETFSSTSSIDPQIFNKEVNITGEIRIRILRADNEGVNSNFRLNIDDISITNYPTIINEKPIILNIATSPESDNIFADDNVEIKAKIIDNDGYIDSAYVFWGLTEHDLVNEIIMIGDTVGNYCSESNIPKQDANTTIYFKIKAIDNEGLSSESALSFYIVKEDEIEPLPFEENFNNGFGKFKCVSMAGDNNQWSYNPIEKYVFFDNNDSEHENDWLISPKIDLTSYSKKSFFFKIWRNGATNLGDTTLKLMYSTNYNEDSSINEANWKKIDFQNPVFDSNWVYIPTVEITNISDAVNFAFCFKQNKNNKAEWRLDNFNIKNSCTTVLVSDNYIDKLNYYVNEGPSKAQTINIESQYFTGSGNITISSTDNFKISTDSINFTNNILLPYTNGSIVNQPVKLHVILKSELEVGSYRGEIIIDGDIIDHPISVSCSGNVIDVEIPEISSQLMAKYMQGSNTNNNRIPCAFYMEIKKLKANKTYKYYNKMVLKDDLPTYNGVGTPYFVSKYGEFRRSTGSSSFNNVNSYSVFTTDSLGSYSGWFMVEPTLNIRFTPGNELYFRLMLNDGNNGDNIKHRLTASDFIQVLDYGIENEQNKGTAIRGVSKLSPKNFICIYNNDFNSPLAITSIEATGIDYNSNNAIANFYKENVFNNNGSWGAIIPNILPTGVLKIEERNMKNGDIVNYIVSDNGIWDITNTINPSGGLNNVLIIDLTVNVLNLQNKDKFITYYNSGLLKINSNINIKGSATIYNLQGSQIKQFEVYGNNFTYPILLNAGFYLVSIKTNNRIITEKLIVN